MEAPPKKMKSFPRLSAESSAITRNLYRNSTGHIELLLQL
jgi:hypothetical protein